MPCYIVTVLLDNTVILLPDSCHTGSHVIVFPKYRLAMSEYCQFAWRPPMGARSRTMICRPQRVPESWLSYCRRWIWMQFASRKSRTTCSMRCGNTRRPGARSVRPQAALIIASPRLQGGLRQRLESDARPSRLAETRRRVAIRCSCNWAL